jgi:RNA polymerase sigma-70 factor, ECF subfamily
LAAKDPSPAVIDKLGVSVRPAVSPPPDADDCFPVYRRELDYLIVSLRRLGVPASDLEDIVHEVFLVMLRRWDEYDRSRPVRPWLFGIAFRVASGYRRRNGRELLGVARDGEDLAPRPDEAVATLQDRQLLLRALSAVPLARRAVLIMREVDDVAMRDIAQQLSIPLFTAYSRLRKARRELDAALTVLRKDPRRAR